jgi:hypothetical protein
VKIFRLTVLVGVFAVGVAVPVLAQPRHHTAHRSRMNVIVIVPGGAGSYAPSFTGADSDVYNEILYNSGVSPNPANDSLTPNPFSTPPNPDFCNSCTWPEGVAFFHGQGGG